MNDATAVISTLPTRAARMLAVEILLADPEALEDDVLEACLYLLRERLLRDLTANNRTLEERLQAARSNNRFLDKRIADLETQLLNAEADS